MTRTISFMALTGVLLVGAAATSLLFGGSLPLPQLQAAVDQVDGPVSNWEGKQDRLMVASLAPAAYEPPEQTAAEAQLQARAQAAIPDISVSARQTYASASPNDIVVSKPVEPSAGMAAAPVLPKPKAASKPVPAPQKSYSLLSDSQIAGVKERLRLTSSQEYYWPAVETALRAVARKIHAKRQVDPTATAAAAIDPDSAEVQQLKSAAMPLLFQLREDQKNEVRTLARVIGLEKVAAMI